jgi:tetratricopeptide (TPR) repeat protein
VVDYGFTGATVFAAAAAIIPSLFNPSYVMNFGRRIASIFDFNSGSAATRFQIWDAAWRATLDRPFLGWGPDTFRMVFRWFQPPQYNRDAGYRSVADNAHNYLLQVAAGIGIIGAFLLYLLQGWIVVIAARYAWKQPELHEKGKSKRTQAVIDEKEEDARNARLRYVGLLVAALTYCIHLFFGISVPGVTFLLWIVFGILLVPLAEKHSVEAPSRTIALIGFGALIVLSLVASFFASTLLWADHTYARAQVTQAGSDIDLALIQLRSSMRLSPRNDQYAIKYVEYMVEAGSRGNVSIDAVHEAVTDLVERFPNEYDVYLIAIWAYQMMGMADPKLTAAGLEIAEHAIATYPEGLALRYAYAELLMDAERVDEAIAQLNFIINSDPAFAEAQQFLERLIQNDFGFNSELSQIRLRVNEV